MMSYNIKNYYQVKCDDPLCNLILPSTSSYLDSLGEMKDRVYNDEWQELKCNNETYHFCPNHYHVMCVECEKCSVGSLDDLISEGWADPDNQNITRCPACYEKNQKMFDERYKK